MAKHKSVTKTSETRTPTPISDQESQAAKLKEAAELLQAEKDARAAAFLHELQALCKKYGCDLIPTFQVKAN